MITATDSLVGIYERYVVKLCLLINPLIAPISYVMHYTLVVDEIPNLFVVVLEREIFSRYDRLIGLSKAANNERELTIKVFKWC